MGGVRSEAFYIRTYGDEFGKTKYQKLLQNRIVRGTRQSVDPDDPKSRVTCMQCGKVFKRISTTHLKHGCIESITTAEYMKRFPNAPIASENIRKTCVTTEKTMIDKYGEEEGRIRWKSYCMLQAISNTFEYKRDKYWMTRDEYDAYNQGRAMTAANCIKRYGRKIGLQLWDEYCDRQRYTTTLEYFVEEYGLANGTQKYNDFCVGRMFGTNSQSKIQIAAYDELVLLLEGLTTEIQLDTTLVGPFDYGNTSRKKLIEFNGTFWHADRRVYDLDWVNPVTNRTAIEIWRRDLAKEEVALSFGYSVMSIWESDWQYDKQRVIDELVEWYYATNE
jgi:predicted  nucleic acid-binding Zn-ribbon protein